MKPRWRCFHCGDVFTSARAAAEHFGGLPDALAACQIKASHEHGLLCLVRDQERELMRYRADDSPVLRLMAAMQSDHAIALRRAEEEGYARGIRDMQALAEAQFGAEVRL